MVERLTEAFWASDGTLFKTEREAITHETKARLERIVAQAIADSQFHDFGRFNRWEIGGPRWTKEFVSRLIDAGVQIK